MMVKCQLSIKSLAKVKRIIKYFEQKGGVYRVERWGDIAELIRYLFGLPQVTWRKEDFEEKEKRRNRWSG